MKTGRENITVTKTFALLALLLQLTLAPAVIAQDPVNVQLSKAASAVTDAMTELERGISQAQMLAGKIAEAPVQDRESLNYRRDARNLKLLDQVDELAALIVALPESDPARLQLVDHLANDFNLIGMAVQERIVKLSERITDALTEMQSLSGAARAFSESYINSLETTRDSYLAAMVDHLATRRLLALSMDELLPPLREVLLIQAESVAGRISFAALTQNDIKARLAGEPDNADLKSAFNQSTETLNHNLDRLRKLSGLMEQLNLDTTDYRALLASQSTGISLDLIQPNVLSELVSESWMSMKEYTQKNGPAIVLNLLLFVFVILVFRILAKLARRGMQAALDRSRLDMSTLLKNTLISITGGSVMLLGILMALSQVGISLGPMLAGLGIAGFIVGFALQETLANFAAGAMILIYRPYDVDDFVEVTGAAGMVKKMNLVSTTIATFDNQILVVPNGKIWGDVIKNVTGQRVRRVDLEFGIAYSSDMDHALAILRQASDEHELTLSSPEPLIKVNSLGDSSVNLILRPWSKTEDYWTVYWDLIKDVKERFDSAGISIPFPQRDVHFYGKETS